MTRSTIVRLPTNILALALGAALGCATVGAYACTDDGQCVDGGAQGSCEAEGYCAFPDATCPTGKRFGEHAGDGLAGTCAGGATGSGTTDATTDATATASTSTTEPTTGSTTASGTTSAAVCGDGSVDGDETCDDGNQADGDGCSSACQHEPLRVFVTGDTFGGNLGGLAGADATCQKHADDAGLGGAWMAWLSDDAQGPAARFLTKGGPRPYHRLDPDAPLVANDWADLIDGALVAPIDRDAAGNQVKAPLDVWTNTTPAGAPSSVDNTCDGWTLGAGSGSGNHGDASASDSTWTERATTGCQTKLRIYCVEQ